MYSSFVPFYLCVLLTKFDLCLGEHFLISVFKYRIVIKKWLKETVYFIHKIIIRRMFIEDAMLDE